MKISHKLYKYLGNLCITLRYICVHNKFTMQ